MAVPRSPADLMASARNGVLAGREPRDTFDWALVINHVAYSVTPEAALATCQLLKALYDVPLRDNTIKTLVEAQLNERRRERRHVRMRAGGMSSGSRSRATR